MHASSDIRPSNIFNASNFEKVEGILVWGWGLGLSIGMPVCSSLCGLRACTPSIIIREGILEFNIWINYANKMTIFSFSLHLEFQSYSPVLIVLF